jgi:hypothetical protein
MKPVYVKNPAGIITGLRTIGTWDSEAHDKVIERMIRGLYYHHFGEILGDEARYTVQWLGAVPEQILEMSAEWQQHTIGDSQIVYRYGRAVEDSRYSVWLFQFYDKHWASGYTEPVKIPRLTPNRLTGEIQLRNGVFLFQ